MPRQRLGCPFLPSEVEQARLTVVTLVPSPPPTGTYAYIYAHAQWGQAGGEKDGGGGGDSGN